MSSYLILIGLITLLILSPIAVGSVYIIAYSAMEIIVFGLLLIHIWTTGRKSQMRYRGQGPGARGQDDADIGETMHNVDGIRDDAVVGKAIRTPGSRRRHNSSQQFDSVVHDRNHATRNTQHSTLFAEGYLRKTFLLMIPLFIFLAIALFQLIPLPLPVIRAVSPNTAALYEKMGSSLSVFLHPLSFSVYSTTTALLKWCAYAGAFALVAFFNPTEYGRLRNGRWITVLVTAIFAVAFFEAVYGLFIAFNRLDSLLWFGRRFNIGVAAGTWVNPDHLAGFMNMGILCSIGLFASYTATRKSMRKIEKSSFFLIFSRRTLFFWILLLGMLIMILASIFSQSRMGHISLFAALAFTIGLYFMKRSNILALILVVIVGAALCWGIWKGLDPVMAKWSQVDNALYSSRLLVLKRVVALSRDFPIFGTGLGTFKFTYQPYKPADFGAIIYDHAHNDYLEILSEVGVVGFIAFIAFIACFIYAAIGKWFKRSDALARGIGAGGIGAVLSMLIHGLTDFNLQIPANALTFFIIMGLTWRALHTSFRDQSRNVKLE